MARRTSRKGIRSPSIDEFLYLTRSLVISGGRFHNERGELVRHYFLTAQADNYNLTASGHDDTSMADWANLATVDSAVARALTLYGSLDHDWKNLYMVLEVIEEDLGGKSALMICYPELSQRLKVFKRTANSFEAVGREARHAKKLKPQPNPMQIAEARSLIRQLLLYWLNFRLAKE